MLLKTRLHSIRSCPLASVEGGSTAGEVIDFDAANRWSRPTRCSSCILPKPPRLP